MPENTKRRPGRPKKNTTEATEIISSLFSVPTEQLQNDDTDTPVVEDMAQNSSDGLQNMIAIEAKQHSDDIPQANTSSWASKLKPCAKGMKLSYVCPKADSIDIGLEDINSEIHFWETTLVGSFLGSRHSISSVRAYVKQYWNSVVCPEVLYYKKGWFYFKFETEEDCLLVLQEGPWVFGNSSLILKKWTPDFCPQLESVTVVPVWTLFPDLDPCFWSASALSKIASIIGKPLYADPHTTDKSRISFARVLIDVDVSINNPSSIVINTPFGKKTAAVEYEWMPYFCSQCKCIGHTVDKCKKSQPQVPKPRQVWRPVADAAQVTIPSNDKIEVPKTAGMEDSIATGAVADSSLDTVFIKRNSSSSEVLAEHSVEEIEVPKTAGKDDSSATGGVVVSGIDTDFKTVERRSRSPINKIASNDDPLQHKNSFELLAEHSDDSVNMVERGRTSQSPKC